MNETKNPRRDETPHAPPPANEPKGKGAHGSEGPPAAADDQPKWPGGGKKGEDE